ncbi:uncharacterized protein LOC130649242 [Hydractinia symbiolongicarpus]|uniref:uncharacterized protein LOC130649242 n=1 Tax=Hydractinia symbiolongicarpus TaxID=13093 RepID=UPI00254BDBDB|nr:uncharacterized protein LOC130649242 [Hydractinia symbiolongicarpus]
MGVVSTLLFLDDIEIDNKETNVKNVLSKTFQSLLDWRILFLTPISALIGLESGFVFADFNEPITVSCFIPTRRLHSLCLNSLFQSLGYMVGYAYGDYLCIYYILFILLCLSLICVMLYGLVEWSEFKKNVTQ